MLILRTPQPEATNYSKIDLGYGFYALVDPEDYEWLRRWRWRAKKSKSGYYAVRKCRVNGREHLVRMHREITDCPPDKIPHHLNRNTLDNRRCNLENLTPAEHKAVHRFG
ncbi:hypothetical protein ES703_62704 [subsurface metagenome]